MKKYFLPLGVLGIFMTIAVTLWLTQYNIFYLFNFSYIGISIFFGIFLYIKNTNMPAELHSFQSDFICWCIWALFAVKICRLRDFGIICFSVFLKRQLSIMLWQKYLVHCFLARLVWLCLLDGHGAGFSTLQTAAKATKREAWFSSLCDVCIVISVSIQFDADKNSWAWQYDDKDKY